jgi:hypothetical protein
MKTFLIFILFISNILNASKVVELLNLTKPNSITIYNNQIFITDGATIFIFSIGNFGLIAKFGKKGEGPGEFINEDINLQILSDRILISSTSKILFFSKNGKYMKETKIPSYVNNVKKIGNNYIGFKWDINPEADDFYISYNLYKSNFKKLKELHSGNAMIHKNKTRDIFEIFFYDVVKNKIVIVHRKGFCVDIFDIDGNEINSITRNIKPIPFNEKDKQEVVSYWASQPYYKGFYERMKKRLNFPKYFPKIYQCRVSSTKIYIITYLTKGNKRECFIYDLNGKYLKRIFLPLKNESPVDHGIFTIYNDKLYQIIENLNNEIWELHIHDLI